ncbi:MAG TPA: hypothetical protein DIV98_04480, partial [Oceanicaulis sp.]|nr:hypothetical protein [Oceanicaulis sp.]
RPGELRFEADEAIAHIFPVRRDLFDKITPEIRPIQSDPKTAQAMETWRLSRADFAGRLRENDADAAEEKWQKGYYRGLMPDGGKGAPSHKTKLRVKPFTKAAPKTR